MVRRYEERSKEPSAAKVVLRFRYLRHAEAGPDENPAKPDSRTHLGHDISPLPEAVKPKIEGQEPKYEKRWHKSQRYKRRIVA
jgi:hypothetical protein